MFSFVRYDSVGTQKVQLFTEYPIPLISEISKTVLDVGR